MDLIAGSDACGRRPERRSALESRDWHQATHPGADPICRAAASFNKAVGFVGRTNRPLTKKSLGKVASPLPEAVA